METRNWVPLGLDQTLYKRESTLYGILAVLAFILWLALIIGTVGIALVYILFFFLFYLFAHSGFISHLKGNAIEIAPDQFPDLHQRLQACCERLEMKEVPKAYLMASDGILNALATRFLRKHYVVLFSSIVDALDDQPDSLNFYIGHELGHIRRNHLGKGPFLSLVAWLPLIGPAYSRACEYTCDLHGLRCCDSLQAASQAVVVLSAGSEQWKKANIERIVRQVQDTSGFWMSFHELTNDYPWLSKRLQQVVARGQGESYTPPSRNPLAYLFAIFTPRTYGAGGGGIVGVMIVVAIIGILAAVAIPAYKDFTKRAEDMQGWQDYQQPYDSQPDNNTPQDSGNPDTARFELDAQIQSLMPAMDAVVAHFNSQNQWPESLEQAGVSHTLTDQYPSLTLYSEGVMAFYGPESLGDYKEYAMYLEPRWSEDAGEYVWYCYSYDIPGSYLPEYCDK